MQYFFENELLRYYTPLARWSRSTAGGPSEQTKTQFWNPVLEPKSRAQIPWVGYNEPTYLFCSLFTTRTIYYTPLARWSRSTAGGPSEQTKTQFWTPVLKPKSEAQILWGGVYNEPRNLICIEAGCSSLSMQVCKFEIFTGDTFLF